jgi:hypothetical protein
MSFFEPTKPNDIDNWVCVMESGQNYEIDMARNFLSNLKIPSNILSKKDSAYSLVVGDMSPIYLYVPKEFEVKAREALEELGNIDGEASTNEEDA